MLHPDPSTCRLGEILVTRGDCTPRVIEEALDDQVVYDGRLGTNLLELGALSEERLARALSIQHGLAAAWGRIEVERDAIAVLAPAAAWRWQAVPFRLDRRCLDVLVSEARDLAKLDELAFAVGREVRPVLVAEARLWELLRRCYGLPCPARKVRARRRAVRERAARAVPAQPLEVEPVAVQPEFGGRLASSQELLAELQRDAARGYRPRLVPTQRSAPPIAVRHVVAVARPSGEGASPLDVPDGALVSDAQLLVQLQDDADRRYRRGAPSHAAAPLGSGGAGARTHEE